LVDIVPTVLQALGIAAAAPLDGVPIDGRRELMLAEDFRVSWPVGRLSPRHGAGSLALIVDGLKYLRNDDGSEELFDLDQDPLEERNLAETMPDAVASLRSRLEAWSRTVAERRPRRAPPAPLPAEVEEGLRALGYVE
jgi:arylsulfatase A-like enzyme